MIFLQTFLGYFYCGTRYFARINYPNSNTSSNQHTERLRSKPSTTDFQGLCIRHLPQKVTPFTSPKAPRTSTAADGASPTSTSSAPAGLISLTPAMPARLHSLPFSYLQAKHIEKYIYIFFLLVFLRLANTCCILVVHFVFLLSFS